jgi:serine/threonine protein kinase
MGTIDYMAPEQANDTKHADARADIYSLGVTIWFLLTGRAMYQADTTVQKLMAHQQKPVPSLRAACPAASAELEAVFTRMVTCVPPIELPCSPSDIRGTPTSNASRTWGTCRN